MSTRAPRLDLLSRGVEQETGPLSELRVERTGLNGPGGTDRVERTSFPRRERKRRGRLRDQGLVITKKRVIPSPRRCLVPKGARWLVC